MNQTITSNNTAEYTWCTFKTSKAVSLEMNIILHSEMRKKAKIKQLKILLKELDEALDRESDLNKINVNPPPTIIPGDIDINNPFKGGQITYYPSGHEACLFDQFYKQNPEHQGALFLHCPCPKCSPFC